MDSIIESNNVKTKRESKYDLLRIIFMCMVLAVHLLRDLSNNIMEKYNTTWYINIILNNFLIICNPLFFMLSGRFNLKKTFNKKEDYKKYYINKFISLIVPFILVSTAIFIYKNKSFDISKFVLALLNGKGIESIYWFVYVLISISLLSPFFSKMLQNMNIEEKKIFLGLSFVINLVISSLEMMNIETRISFNSVGIVKWHFYYFAGYLIEDIFKDKKKYKYVYLSGIFVFVIQFFIERFMECHYSLSDPNALLTIKTFAFYLFLKEKVNVKNANLEKIIIFIAQYSYIFYLLHVRVLMNVSSYFRANIDLKFNILDYIFIYIIAFTITLLMSIIIQEIIISPVQKLIKKASNRYLHN